MISCAHRPLILDGNITVIRAGVGSRLAGEGVTVTSEAGFWMGEYTYERFVSQLQKCKRECQ